MEECGGRSELDLTCASCRKKKHIWCDDEEAATDVAARFGWSYVEQSAMCPPCLTEHIKRFPPDPGLASPPPMEW